MKLKRLPEDFRVEELHNVSPGESGRYRFYRLTKRGIGTLEALDAIRRRWNLAASQVSYGGLKDRHALTVQYLTIADGAQRPLVEQSFQLEPLGRINHPYGPSSFRGNRFELTLRDFAADAAKRAEDAAAKVEFEGLPNYFDDQRFGSVGFDGGFIAEAWLKGDHEQALRLAIAEPNRSDRPETRTEKAILRETWGDWPAAKARLERSHARSLVTYLVDHPTDFRGAFARVRRELRSLYFSAYQSYLWNLWLARLIESTTRPDQRVPIDFKVATLPLFRDLDADQAARLRSASLPLPSTRNTPPADQSGNVIETLLAERGLTWGDLRVKHLKDVFFSKGSRAALFFPSGLAARTEPDDLYPGRRKLLLSFDLPKGAYATLLVKRVTDGAAPE
jgi:tRNA pseudouridine13 synthase